jgi:multiple sugar transport system substrate-binding protein
MIKGEAEMKKTFLFTIILIATLLIVSCTPTETKPVETAQSPVTEAPKPVETTVAPVSGERPKLTLWLQVTWTDAGDAYIKSEVEKYAADNGFDVDLYMEDSPVNDPKFQAGIETGVLPDIGWIWKDTPIRMVQAGRLLDLSAEFAKMDATGGGVVDGAKAAATIDGKQYGLPFNSFSEVLVIRDDLAQAKGLNYPEQFTFDELLNWAKALNEPGTLYGWGQILGEPAESSRQELGGYLIAFGGSVYGEDGKTVTINSPETINFLNYMKEAWDAGVIPPDSPTWSDSGDNQLYLAGGAAIINNGPSVIMAMRNDQPDLASKSKTMLPPAGPAGRPFDVLGGGQLVVFSTTKYPDLAKGLAQHLTSLEVNRKMSEISGLMQPVYKDVGGEWASDPLLSPYLEMLKYNVGPGYPGPDTLWAWEAYNSDVVKNMVNRVLIQGTSPEESAKMAADEAQKIYDSYSH